MGIFGSTTLWLTVAIALLVLVVVVWGRKSAFAVLDDRIEGIRARLDGAQDQRNRSRSQREQAEKALKDAESKARLLVEDARSAAVDFRARYLAEADLRREQGARIADEAIDAETLKVREEFSRMVVARMGEILEERLATSINAADQSALYDQGLKEMARVSLR